MLNLAMREWLNRSRDDDGTELIRRFPVLELTNDQHRQELWWLWRSQVQPRVSLRV